ncbi:uncharacterized protein VDAG_00563 [Verticillium dahliae VdLs.17]|uniref:Uncharacterized protein n=1 Tax=Verticillium dahliae (strain VdLs.17 / ATCC MYA-4575 / FGSC 10137) TaxID=498257 RepID=G2WQC1_VERDV|nr:uncharacterized protein VDAG_00563 [Verticillium dahliae VdLs.17]EGY13881.1 hypothetical protein VDAG_00563 [Verticillium dahliae VdLs.17]
MENGWWLAGAGPDCFLRDESQPGPERSTVPVNGPIALMIIASLIHVNSIPTGTQSRLRQDVAAVPKPASWSRVARRQRGAARGTGGVAGKPRGQLPAPSYLGWLYPSSSASQPEYPSDGVAVPLVSMTNIQRASHLVTVVRPGHIRSEAQADRGGTSGAVGNRGSEAGDGADERFTQLSIVESDVPSVSVCMTPHPVTCKHLPHCLASRPLLSNETGGDIYRMLRCMVRTQVMMDQRVVIRSSSRYTTTVELQETLSWYLLCSTLASLTALAGNRTPMLSPKTGSASRQCMMSEAQASE